MAHSFIQLSQEEHREQVGYTDAWPLLSLSYDQPSQRLTIAGCHHTGRIDVFEIDLNKSVLSAPSYYGGGASRDSFSRRSKLT